MLDMADRLLIIRTADSMSGAEKRLSLIHI